MDRDIRYCQNQLSKAKRKRRQAENRLEKNSSTVISYSNIISDCQQCIELCGKVLFVLVGEDPPKEHGLDFENGQRVLRSEFPERFNRETDIARVIFITQLWEEFYTIAKYGDENYSIPADDLFEREDAELAVSHAKFCYRVTSELYNSVPP